MFGGPPGHDTQVLIQRAISASFYAAPGPIRADCGWSPPSDAQPGWTCYPMVVLRTIPPADSPPVRWWRIQWNQGARSAIVEGTNIWIDRLDMVVDAGASGYRALNWSCPRDPPEARKLEAAQELTPAEMAAGACGLVYAPGPPFPWSEELPTK